MVISLDTCLVDNSTCPQQSLFSGISRDMVVQGYGADCLREHGKVIINARSIDRYHDQAMKECSLFVAVATDRLIF